MIYSYKCQICGHEQEIWHKMNDKNTEPCEKCKAPAKKMKKQTNWQPAHGQHGSWSRWNV